MAVKILYWIVVFLIPLSFILVPVLIARGKGTTFFTSLRAGTGAIVGGGGKLVPFTFTDKNGKQQTETITEGWTYDHVILPKGWSLVPNESLGGKLEIVKGSDEDFDSPRGYLAFLKSIGVYYIGFPFLFQRVTYPFEWSEFDQSGNLLLRKEPTNFFYIARVEYAIVLEGVEIGGNLKVNLKFVVFGHIAVPEIAFDENVDIIKQLTTTLYSEATTYFRSIPFEELKTNGNDKAFETLIMKSDTKKTIGFVIDEVRFVEIGGDLVGKVQEASQSAYVAEKECNAEIIKAEKKLKVTEVEAKGTRTKADAERYRIEQKNKAIDSSPNGLTILRYEAMEKAGAGGNTVVFDNGTMDQTSKNTLIVTDRIRDKHKPKKEEGQNDSKK